MKISINKPAYCNREQKSIQNVQYRTTPFLIVVLFALSVTGIRIYMMPQFSWMAHATMFLLQLGILTGIWHFIRRLNIVLNRYMPFEEGPVARIMLQVSITMLMIGPVMICMGILVKHTYPDLISKPVVAISVILFIVVIILLNFGFYSFYFFRSWQGTIEQNAELEVQAASLQREKYTLQYHQLRNQVNPHYLFNTLTSLDGLIHTDPELASEFVRHMSKVYRYVLQHKESEVVSLYEELEFIDHYIELLRIRYADALHIDLFISPEARERGIVMVTLQMLIDNAIKHNMVHNAAPLTIQVKDEDGYLCISNNKQLRKQIETSNGQGLLQLKQLYAYLSEVPILIADSDDNYVIKIPFL